MKCIVCGNDINKESWWILLMPMAGSAFFCMDHQFHKGPGKEGKEPEGWKMALSIIVFQIAYVTILAGIGNLVKYLFS